jgi:hypothetical protein
MGTFRRCRWGWRLSEYEMFKGFLGLSDLSSVVLGQDRNQAFANYQQYSSYRIR